MTSVRAKSTNEKMPADLHVLPLLLLLEARGGADETPGKRTLL